MGRPPHDRARGAAIQPWPSSRRSRTRPPRADHAAPFRPGARAAPATRGAATPGPPRRALAGQPRQAGRGPGALRADAGYLAAPGEHTAFAVGARPEAVPPAAS